MSRLIENRTTIRTAHNQTTGALVFVFLLLFLSIVVHFSDIIEARIPVTQHRGKADLVSGNKELLLATAQNLSETPLVSQVNHAHTPFFFMPVRVNDASLEMLTTITGIGPTIAARILEFRTKEGRVGSVDQLLSISGIGPEKLVRIRPYLTVQ
ncbi:helix-hairpin-helix domain-containing protein [Desulfopila sp. IMCC35008]|uniref:ComEA family DNA-binding protein n=1 Tax=Desulfopila sp. IMCC35008 TaxID=2653858 RepID=UPI0013D56E30|nr:helix-hairpin-helix domain-containing protein [Desulfopila sp. IMCC35008]